LILVLLFVDFVSSYASPEAMPPGTPVVVEPYCQISVGEVGYVLCLCARILVTRRAPSTTAADTFDSLVLLQLCLGYSTDAGGVEVRFLRLYAT